MSKESIIGQYVSVYLDGGWMVSGEVSLAKEDRIFLNNNDDIFMISRSKISAIHLNARRTPGEDNEEHAYRPSKGREPPDRGAFMSGGADSPGTFLPIDMLTKEAQDEVSSDDFSVFFGGDGKKSGPGSSSGISFVVGGEDGDSKE